MEFEIEKVFERDIDLYIINKFINDSKFKNMFLSKIDCQDYNICKCIHSFSDENGESDITVILENNNKKIGLLIEDKISAIAMPKQYERYKIRAEKQVHDCLFEEYYIFIVAPESYLNSNDEAQKYDNKISYEEILTFISDDLFGKCLIKEAIEEKKKGYSVIENKSVTMFWEKYYNLVEQKYNNLYINRHEGARGSNACWPIFLTPVKNIQIYHKSDKGFIDLTFPGVSQYFFEVYDLIKDALKDNMTLQKAGKSLAIRIIVPEIDFKSNFEEQEEKIVKCLDAVVELQNLIRNINYNEILKLSKK